MIAYFILVHRYPEQFKRLFHAIYDASNQYLIHVDKRADKTLYKELHTFLAGFPNVSFLKSQNVVWGGYSMVETELRGIKKLLKVSKNWDFFINLSGQDFPLKSQLEIKNFLKGNRGKSFIKIEDQIKMRPNTLNRIHNYFVESGDGFSGKPIKRSYMKNVIPHIGGQWKVLSRECCEFITSSSKIAKFRKFYKHTLIPDEGFFQTVLMNTAYPGEIVNNDKRAIIWVPEIGVNPRYKNLTQNSTKSLIASGKIKLRPKTFTVSDKMFLQKSNALFARKFDESVDKGIIDLLEPNLHRVKESTKKTKIKLGVEHLPSLSTNHMPLFN